ncbi:RNA 2',3'-cyclic phosphodiesterase [Halorubellus sp. JP-L1]|uniref:RNA 2',3'-cyclic phosphodiesterase n=1 Tax=Halorubellus sp. JP-L1 TaxID=2715753 RepID=UPI00140E08E7|nr:RNA 2',3'-cyclic phosphodiesterase [Halorubellus sp. JP-L1]NHN43566.1 RNA 2',3'-cyclic phosphodiesterase [Halorubellus sp. JP-L1]
MRLFVSVDLPDALAPAVADVQSLVADAAGVDPTDPEQTHVTLQFLGETPEHRLDAVADAVQAAVDDADVDPFEVEYGDLGVFPSLDYVSVVWLGVREGDLELARLHEAVERETTALGYDPEDHEFTPHATIARVRHGGGKDRVQSVVVEEEPTVGTATVDEVRLTESVLTDDGPRYETVRSFEL